MFLKPQVCVEYGNQTREHQSGHQSSYWLWTSVLIIIIIQPTVKVSCPAGYVTLSSRVPDPDSFSSLIRIIIIIIIQPTVKVSCPSGYVTLSSRVPDSFSSLIKHYYYSTYSQSIMSSRLWYIELQGHIDRSWENAA